MAGLRITWADVEGLRRFDNMLKSLGEAEMRKVANRAINHTGDIGLTAVKRALVAQTGLKYGAITRSLGVKRSSWGTLQYVIMTSRGQIPLRFFAARETRKGVTAAPFGKRQLYPGAFIKGGVFPRRVPLSMGGNVFKRVGSARLPFEKVESGVVLSAELLKGATAEAFERTVRTHLPARVEHELRRATGGALG